MPGWLQAFAEHQPVTVMVDAVRALALGDSAEAVLGHGAGHYVVAAVVWAAAITVVFGTVAVARFNRR
jgi:ABC-2 type transport system permease protein/oleandomycin transport system permease protein